MSESHERGFAERVAAPLRAAETVDPTFDARLLAAARSAIARGEAPWQQPNVTLVRTDRRAWLTTPRRFSMSPLVGLAAAAVFTGVVVGSTLAVTRAQRGDSRRDVVTAASAKTEAVRFVIVMPTASHVALVGDFNGWNPAATRLARDPGGRVWTVTVPLMPGTYQYSFVVDGRAWVADPSASLSVEDDFGAPSSILTVGRGT